MSSHAIEGISGLILTGLADSIAVVVLECTSLARFAEGTAIATEALVCVDDALLATFTCLVALASVNFTSFTSINGVIAAPVM